MRKLYRSLLATGAVFGLAACGDDVTVTPPQEPTPIAITGIAVSPQNATIGQGATIQLSASVQTNGGDGEIDLGVTWTSSNNAVATVSGSGQVTGVGGGTATITARSNGNTSYSASAAIVVTVPRVESVSVTPGAATLVVGQTLNAIANVVRDAGVAGTVTWATSAQAVATVNTTSGLISAVTPGTAVITATSTVDNSKAGSMALTVVAQPVALKTLSVTPLAVTMGAGASTALTAVVTTETGATVTYSNNASQAASGCPGKVTATTDVNTGATTVTGVAAGACVVTVTASGSGTGLQSNSLSQAVSVSIIAAQLSINSITANATGLPVVLNNVAGQIDINLNFDPRGLEIDSVVVRMNRGTTPMRAAKQDFGGAVPAAGIVTLSVNTANFTLAARGTGTAIVDWFNGPNSVSAQIYPKGLTGGSATNCQIAANDPNCASPQAIVLNNVDGWAAEIVKCSLTNTNTSQTPNGGPAALCPTAVPAAPAAFGSFATSTGGSTTNAAPGGAAATVGLTYNGGPGASGATTAQIYPIVYNNNPAFAAGSALNRCTGADGIGCITTVQWTIGTPNGDGVTWPLTDGTCGLTAVQTAAPFVASFGTAGTVPCVYQNTTITRNNIRITTATDGVNQPYPLVGASPAVGIAPTTLIPNAVVFGATPDSVRLDYVGPTVTTPTVVGAELFNWVNAAWAFNPGGTVVTDAGVGAVGTNTTWRAFASANGGSTTVYPTAITTGADLAETNQNCTGAGCDGYNARASAVDRLGNGNNSANSAAFGDDKTSPLVRYSSVAGTSIAPLPSIYLGGGSGALTTMDSTLNNQAGPAPSVIQVLPAPAAGDSIRIEAIDNRSGLSREVTRSRRFAQGGATGTTSAALVPCETTTGAFGASFGDGWRPGVEVHMTCGSALPGYYTTTKHAVDRAGNVSGVTTTAPSTAAGSNPAVPGAQNSNLYFRRIVALDPAQPLVTGVSPNNNYTGNSLQSWSLGSQDDLEVIDARLRIQYPNVTIGDAGGTITPLGGLVWSYSLSNVFMPAGFSAGTASGTGANFGFFSPIASRWDASVVNPQVTSLTQDMFTLNVQETCLGTGASTGPATAATCAGGTLWGGDPIPTVDIALASPSTLGVQVRDVFGSWSFNSVAGAATGVSAEFISPILPATVAAPGAYTVGYSVVAPGCPAGNGAPGGPCVTSGINFRADGGAGTTRNFRAVQPLSVTLPVFTRVELYALNGAGEWVFVQRCTVPSSIAPNGSAACGGGTVTGSDNGLERYWVYSFTSIPVLPAASFPAPVFRAVGVNAAGFGLFSTPQP